MNTPITRRSLALGGPTALALRTLAPIGALGTLGSMHTGANAAVTLTIDGFLYFYKIKYQPWIAKHVAIMIGLTVARKTGMQLGTPAFSSFIRICATIPDQALTLYRTKLNATEQYELFVSILSTFFNLPAGNSNYNLPTRPFTQQDVNSYASWLYSLSIESINSVKQYRPYDWTHILTFVRNQTPYREGFALFMARADAAETEHDGRYLIGRTKDRLVPASGGELRLMSKNSTGEERIEYGSFRRAVERKELANANDRIGDIIVGPQYAKMVMVNVGINSTAVVPDVGTLATGLITSTDYVLSSDQLQGIDGYVNDDIAKNGAFDTMTLEQSRRALRSATIFVSRQTGLVYESYLIAQLAIRTASQATIAMSRHLIYTKSINFGVLQEAMTASANNNEVIQALAATSRAKLLTSLGILGGLLVGSVVFAAAAAYQAKKIVASNQANNTTTTAAQDAAAATRNFLIGASTAQTTSQLIALGIYGTAGLSKAFCETQIAKWIGTGFLFADLAGGVVDIVGVLRAGGNATVSTNAVVVGGLFRIMGAGYTILDNFLPMYNKTFKKNASLPLLPIQVTTFTAAMATGFYGLATLAAAANRR